MVTDIFLFSHILSYIFDVAQKQLHCKYMIEKQWQLMGQHICLWVYTQPTLKLVKNLKNELWWISHFEHNPGSQGISLFGH